MALESMAWGCIPIVAGHGGLLEIVDDKITGLVFQPGDAASLRLKIETVLHDAELCCDIRRNGPARVREKFSLDAHYEAVQVIYEIMREEKTVGGRLNDRTC
jgi:glycosyltransferase involved in cell wall biosynthesis